VFRTTCADFSRPVEELEYTCLLKCTFTEASHDRGFKTRQVYLQQNKKKAEAESKDALPLFFFIFLFETKTVLENELYNCISGGSPSP
jgi:hypothetical protein